MSSLSRIDTAAASQCWNALPRIVQSQPSEQLSGCFIDCWSRFMPRWDLDPTPLGGVSGVAGADWMPGADRLGSTPFTAGNGALSDSAQMVQSSYAQDVRGGKTLMEGLKGLSSDQKQVLRDLPATADATGQGNAAELTQAGRGLLKLSDALGYGGANDAPSYKQLLRDVQSVEQQLARSPKAVQVRLDSGRVVDVQTYKAERDNLLHNVGLGLGLNVPRTKHASAAVLQSLGLDQAEPAQRNQRAASQRASRVAAAIDAAQAASASNGAGRTGKSGSSKKRTPQPVQYGQGAVAPTHKKPVHGGPGQRYLALQEMANATHGAGSRRDSDTYLALQSALSRTQGT